MSSESVVTFRKFKNQKIINNLPMHMLLAFAALSWPININTQNNKYRNDNTCIKYISIPI
jgi:hypothetical protein